MINRGFPGSVGIRQRICMSKEFRSLVHFARIFDKIGCWRSKLGFSVGSFRDWDFSM